MRQPWTRLELYMRQGLSKSLDICSNYSGIEPDILEAQPIQNLREARG